MKTMNKFNFFFFFVFSFCSVDYETEFLKLEKKAKESISKQDKKKIIKVIEDLEKLETEYTKEKILQLSTLKDIRSFFYLVPSKKLFFFSKDNSLYLLYKNTILELEKKVPDFMISSYSGNYLLFIYKENETCNNEFYQLKINHVNKNFSLEINKVFEFQDKCFPKVITDTGKIFFSYEGEIYEKTKTQEMLVLNRNSFKTIFKKNSHKIYLYPLPNQGFWLFYGNFGYYDLYHYNESKIKQILKGATIPKVFFTIQDLFTEDSSADHYYFVLTGGAGEYSYMGFQLPDQVWKSFNIPYREDYIYIMNQKQFLFSEDEYLNLYNITTNKEIRLPIKVNTFDIFNGNLILISNHQIFIRKEPFDNLEKKIFALKEDLYFNIR